MVYMSLSEKEILEKAKDFYNLDYTKIIKKVDDESGSYFVGSFLEIPEAKTNADDIMSLQDRMQEVLELSIERRIQDGEVVPLPFDDDDFSGKFTLRLPKSLHKLLSIQAEKEGISLNQYALYKLSR